ncbi:sugar phosphate isomerase/epimerase [Microbispora sp. NEAU-D428]|uniref:sugar phosphate isomerase/epimerase family protein n=1 Tax=Microbispora sitophila TaxID=2771537 RepID=UPI0018693032|nr:sugar phosphate isomerase/epimerase family protein [Microbispora sitophila]MBE3014678.1 sugar phosphate isomerase/epimerase [Microbispora sitophila]
MSCLVGLAEWRLPASGAEAVRLAAAAGADGVQLDLGGPGRGEWADAPGRVDALRAEAEARDVRLLALAGNHFNDLGLIAEPGVVRPALERLLDAAVALGVPLVFVPSFRRSAIDGPDAFARTAEVLRWAADQAEGRGLVLANENVLPAERARALAEEVGSPAFRLVLDTFNPVKAGLRADALVAPLAGLLADQVHLKDGPPDAGATPLLGSGDGGLDDTVDALREHLAVHAFVLENDYRDGDRARLAVDLAWARQRAGRFPATEEGA